MKKILSVIAIAIVGIVLTGCADSKTFKKSDGTEFTAKPYGWMDKGEAIEGVNYKLCKGNLVLSVLLGETVAAPVLLTGLELWEPVSYNEPNNNK